MFWYTIIKEKELEKLMLELEGTHWLLKIANKEIQMNRENKKRILEMESASIGNKGRW